MKKLAIVGSGSLTREQAPFYDESFDIWVFNEAPMFDWCKRYTASFQMHKPEVYRANNVKSAGYWEWLQKETKPVFMNGEDPQVPGCEVYPLQEALKLSGLKFFGMSTCYAVALALLKGYEHIELWGIELSSTEYVYGIDSWMFWVGFAKGKLGQDHFVLHSGENLFSAPLYGMEGGTKFEDDFFSNRITFLDNGWKSAEKSLQNIKSLLDKYLTNNEYEKFLNLFVSFEKAALDAGEYAGSLSEAEKWNGIKDWVIGRNELEMASAIGLRDSEEKRTLMIHNGGMVEYVWTIWEQTGNKNAADQLRSLVKKHGLLAYETGALHGVKIEDQSYMQKYDDMMLASGIKLKEISTSAKEKLRCL